MDDKWYQMVLKPEALSQITEVQASLARTASLLQPTILQVAEDQRRLNEAFRLAVEPVSTHLQHVAVELSSNAAMVQNQIIEMQKNAAAAFMEMHSVSAGISEAMRAAAATASFLKYDALIQSAVTSLRLYDLSYVAVSIRSLSESVYRYFEPATTAYQAWRDSMALSIPNSVQVIPLSVPVREQFLTTDFIGSFQETPIYEEELIVVREGIFEEVEGHLLLSLPEALNQLNPSLYRLWRGAWDSLTSSNPDKIRHTLTSARELVTQVLHELSPDEQIRGWSSEPQHFANGRPTRRARLLFIASHLESDVLRGYLVKEVEACLSLIELFQVGTHGVAPSFSDPQLKLVLRKVHSMICTLVEMRNGKG
jgi:hypothetical protein